MIRWLIFPVLLVATTAMSDVEPVENALEKPQPQWQALVRQPSGAITRLVTRAPNFDTATSYILTGYCREQIGVVGCIVEGPYRIGQHHAKR